MSGIPTTAEKKSTYTEHFPCRIPVWRILQPFPHFCEAHNTHSLSAPSGPPAWPEASLSELHQPFMSSRGLRPEGLSQTFPLKQAPIIACGVSGGLGPSPFFPVTAPTRRRENSGGWHRLWTLRLGPSLPPILPALRLCIPVCLCAVVSQVCGLLCDHLHHSIHHLCHVRLCKCNYMCIRATSIQHLNVSGSWGE